MTVSTSLPTRCEMERNLHACPSFLKLLMEDDFRKEIRIPNAFIRDFKNKLLRKCVLKGTTEKKSWPVRICRRHNQYYICKREWPNFVKDHKLKYGDYLLFWLVKKRTFKVIHYGSDCTKNFEVSCCEGSDPSSSIADDEFDCFEEDDIDKEDEDGGDDAEAADEDDDVDPSNGHSAKNSKYKKRRIDSGRSNHESQKSKKSRNSEKTGTEVKVEDETEREKTTYSIVHGYSDIDLKNPYFIVQMKASYTSEMPIWKEFARGTELNLKPRMFALHGEDDREWPVRIRISNGRYFFGAGWPKFSKGYKLQIGDKCRFTLLKRLGNVFNVEIIRK